MEKVLNEANIRHKTRDRSLGKKKNRQQETIFHDFRHKRYREEQKSREEGRKMILVTSQSLDTRILIRIPSTGSV